MPLALAFGAVPLAVGVTTLVLLKVGPTVHEDAGVPVSEMLSLPPVLSNRAVTVVVTVPGAVRNASLVVPSKEAVSDMGESVAEAE
ncbi:MAG: hypothetical protein D6692_14745 [Planctomycetota bacterium]|nr:MAG: hypothetical protein D6692_14745 [Planctomycetota bacterium]